MRRSCAPSMRKSNKRTDVENHDNIPSSSTSNISPIKWGSKHQDSKNSSTSTNIRCPLSDKRIFRVVWRNITTKKHKTWNGDGVLEVTSKRAVLKDDNGMYLGCATRFKANELQENYEMTVGSKEIELQTEITSAEEYWAQHDQMMSKRAWGEEEWKEKNEDNKKPKGGFIFRPVLCLDRPQVSIPSKRAKISKENVESSYQSTTLSTPYLDKLQTTGEYICLLQPSDMQASMLDQCHYLFCQYEKDVIKEFTPSQIIQVCQQICDHPILIQQYRMQESFFLRELVEILPEWSEMGPDDSAKFEFIQYFLNKYSVAPEKFEKCIIVAHELSTLDILVGYCDYMEIKYVRIDEAVKSNDYVVNIEHFNSCTLKSPVVLFLQTKVMLTDLIITNAKRLIFYNYAENCKLAEQMKNVDIKIYHLITAGCVEETLFNRYLRSEHNIFEHSEIPDIINFHADDVTCLTHRLLGCECNGSDKCEPNKESNGGYTDKLAINLFSWKHNRPPFSDEFLEDASLTGDLKMITYIFSKVCSVEK